MVLLAKALSGGFAPVGAILMRRAIFDKMFDRMDRAGHALKNRAGAG